MSESPNQRAHGLPTSATVSTRSVFTNFTPNISTKSHSMSKRRILIVDDDLASARILKTGLEKIGGYEVLTELRAARAVSAARQFQPDLILLDVCLIDGDGGDVAFHLRRDERLRNVPIVFLTSIISQEEARNANALHGDFHYLAKPVRLGRVITCIEKHLGTADSCKQLSIEGKST